MENLAKNSALLKSYDEILDIYVEFVGELGVTQMSVAELLKLEIGSIIELEKPAGDSAELYINKRVFGKGGIMVYDKKFAIRVNEILDSKSVFQYFEKELT